MRQSYRQTAEVSPRTALIRLLARQIVAAQLGKPVAASGTDQQNRHHTATIVPLRKP